MKNFVKFRSPGILEVPYKGLRGLMFQQEVYQFRPQIFESIRHEADGFVSLKPGEETPFTVKVPKLKPNANVKFLKAKLDVKQYTPSQNEDLKLNHTAEVTKNEAKSTFTVKVDVPVLPRNIVIRLDGGEIFWTLPGDLTEAEYTSPDISEHVNTYLDKLPPDATDVILRFLVKSDTYGSVNILIDNSDIMYSLIQTQTWVNELDNTIRFDRNVQLGYGETETLELDEIEDQNSNNILIRKVELDIGGDFGEERLLGNIPPRDITEFATISSDYFVAQKIMLDAPVKCSGISGFFQSDTEAEIYIEIQADHNGFPCKGLPLSKSNLTLTPITAEENDKKQLFFSSFETTVDLLADTPYWIIIKGIQGKVRLGLGPSEEDYLQRIVINRGGQLWKGIVSSAETTVAQLRLIYLPDIDNQTAAIDIGLEHSVISKKLEPSSEGQTISLDIPSTFDKNKITLLVKSHAQGTLSIANVIQEYSPEEEES